MKRNFFLLLLTFSVKMIFAECLIRGMSFYPQQKEISLNSMFIIQGYEDSQETVYGFRERIVYLESEKGEFIKLNLQEVFKGQMNLAQAIFKPSEELKPNTIYFLKYYNQTEPESREMEKYNSEKKVMEKVYWKTSEKKNLAYLNSNLKIIFEKTEVIEYGCGPSANAVFEIKNKSQAEVWYRTEVVDLSNNTKKVFYILDWKNKLNVGHGMCAGAFTYSNKGEYKVRFTPMNLDGKRLQTTNWKTFRNPYMDAKSLFGNY